MPQGIHGVVLLDKPDGITSQTAVTMVKRALHAQKAGHTGTLDPMATGLLPVCLGEATKYSQDLLDADKTYLATLRFGQKTTTGDAEGEVVATGEVAFDVSNKEMIHAELNRVAQQFIGSIQQIPPMHSALKRDGKPLYEYARAGEVLEREPRQVTIHSIEWLDMNWPIAQMRVACSKGTYIRTLAEDIGEILGCYAHLIGLRRERVGHLSLQNSVAIEDLKNHSAPEKHLLPIDALVQDLATVSLDDDQARRLCLGQRVPVERSGRSEELLRIYRHDVAPDHFLGTADWRQGVLHPRRLLSMEVVNLNIVN